MPKASYISIEEEQDPLSLVGNRYDRLKVIRPAPPSLDCNCPRWRAQCDCGNIIVVTTWGLESGGRTSCGCQNQLKDRRAKLAA
jgi:hypothetical protein